MTRRTALFALALPLSLPLGGCLTDAETAGNRSVLPVGSRRAGRDPDDDNPRQICESTMIGDTPKSVCY